MNRQAEGQPPAETGSWQVSNEDYHADVRYVSHSSLEDFRESAGRYFCLYVSGSIERPKSTKAQILGSAVDCMLFEPQLFSKRFHRGKIKRNTKAGKAAHASLVLSTGPDIHFLDAIECEKLDAMVAAIRANKTLATYLRAPGKPQRSLRWIDQATGIACKCRFDLLLDSGHGLDIKTAIDPTPDGFSRAALTLGYHRQAAFYRHGREAILGVKLDAPMLHGVVGSEPPHEVAVYELGPKEWQLGEQQNAADLAELAECRRTGVWEHGWQIGIFPLTFKPWVFRN